MIKKSILQVFVIGSFLLTSTFCSSADKNAENTTPPDETTANTEPKKDAPSKRDGSGTEVPVKKEDAGSNIGSVIPIEPLMDEFNEKLKDVRYPDGEAIEGFEYKKWDIPNRKDFVNWIKGSGKLINEAMDKLPASIKLEITGHADNVGPEKKEGNRLGNIYYSTKRAEEVKKYIVKLLPESAEASKKLEARLVTRGAGSSELIPGIDGASAKNRRVTFKFISTDSTTESGSNPTTESGSNPSSELDSQGK